jgi:ribosomal-protein-serine acetyltransferase
MFRYPLAAGAELRLLELHHAEQVFDLVEQNREHLRRWLTWVDTTHTVHDSRTFIRNTLQQFADNRGFSAGIWYQGALAGVIGYNYIDWQDSKAEFGYWLGEPFQGRGLMTRACRALMSHAFDELYLNRVEILCATGNARSRAIPERLGFTQEGVLRQAEWLTDRFVDLVVYAMLVSDWRRQP